MSTTLEAKLRAAASADTDLAALLGTSPFRWFDTQLDLASKVFPAVVVQLVSSSDVYAFNRRLPGGFNRVQFTIWGDSGQQARQVEGELVCFLNQFNAIGIPNLQLYPNLVLNRRSALYVDTSPPKYQRIVDVSIFDNENVN